MADQERQDWPEPGEKGEKADEKVREKEEEKVWGEKWSRDPLSAIAWALILIWAGVALLVANLELLEQFPLLADFGGWGLAFTGAGVILLVEALIRSTVPAYAGPVMGNLILGLIFLAIGIGDVLTWDVLWPLIIIALGVSFLLRGLLRRS